MNVSLNWLGTHLDVAGKSIKEIDDLLTFAGVEVEGIETKGIASEKIVVAQIMEAVQHPNADKLKVTQVDAGEGSLRQIVCGAKNYKVGDKVPCALPGAALPGGFTIGEAKMRGVESKGMLCAASEIGLPEGEDGLLILPEDAVIGRPVKEMFDSDVLLELEVTPNRPDLLSHRGMARELAALLKTPLIPLETPEEKLASAEGKIRVEATDTCPFYSAIRIRGVEVKDSPAWLKQRLESIGLKPINNIVDVTNFVLHELGQPLHAFDAAKVSGAIVVRPAKDGEIFHALDDEKYELSGEDLLISDESGAALALGGVMGGLESGVSASTTEILLEAAYFTPQGIRRTSRKTALMSDSSYRFERGVDPAGVLKASALAVKLILETAGGEADAAVLAVGEIPVLTQPVVLDAKKLDQLMGGSIALAEAEEILTRLGLTKLADGQWSVPSFRADLQRHIDLVEEIARVHGLDNVPSRFAGAFVPASAVDAAYDADMVLRRRLAALGVFECQTIKLISDAQMQDALPLRPLQDGDVIRVKLPLSEDHVVMRPSIIPGLVASAVRNVRQQAKALRFFEMGRVFRNAGGGKAKDQESENLALLVSGNAQSAAWSQKERAADLYDLKGLISALLRNQAIQFFPRDRDGFVLSCDIKAGDQNIGVFGRIAPTRARELDLPAETHVAELDLAKLRKMISGVQHVEDLPQFPASTRDAAMELAATTANAEIEKVIAKHAEPLLISAECFDVFTDPSGEKLAADRKSVAYRFTYRDSGRTLKSDEVDAAHQKMLAALTKGLGVSFR
ncbi:phenylalanine--tRNA ligase subunit beta [Luteolibacter pohnpeiensis]|uniref:Phenylalanine--tRNA ligase beta subunit n=1 Tax=Luteolibacter pohnpeiensis TaxID=454153 RepID=A0A934S9W4_9BACT|nr:phenylalanine--tRNA ligase subunit beta [Luteolibacter pohnpeiensis]MBK1881478.1 phenylalanine--tRNA ligase subunit beta [Luteolibacter pohnpeiensis]